jgi:hypothetical protein
MCCQLDCRTVSYGEDYIGQELKLVTESSERDVPLYREGDIVQELKVVTESSERHVPSPLPFKLASPILSTSSILLDFSQRDAYRVNGWSSPVVVPETKHTVAMSESYNSGFLRSLRLEDTMSTPATAS